MKVGEVLTADDWAEQCKRVADLMRDLDTADELRAAFVQASREAASDLVVVISRLQRAQPVLDAAYAVCDALERDVPAAEGEALCQALYEVVQEHKRTGAAS